MQTCMLLNLKCSKIKWVELFLGMHLTKHLTSHDKKSHAEDCYFDRKNSSPDRIRVGDEEYYVEHEHWSQGSSRVEVLEDCGVDHEHWNPDRNHVEDCYIIHRNYENVVMLCFPSIQIGIESTSNSIELKFS